MKKSISLWCILSVIMPAATSAQWVRSLNVSSPVVSFAVRGSTLIAGTTGRDSAVYVLSDSAHFAPSIYLTTDGGGSWIGPAGGIPLGGCVNCLAVQDSTAYAAIGPAPDKYTDINGETNIYYSNTLSHFAAWSKVQSPTPEFYYMDWSMLPTGSGLLLGGAGGLYRSNNGGGSWNYLGQSVDLVSCLLSLPDTSLVAGTYAYGLDRSTDGGAHWTAIDSGIPNDFSSRVIQCLLSSGPYLFAGTQAGIFRSSNKGTSWTRLSSALVDTNVTSFALSGTTIFAGLSSRIIDSAYFYGGQYYSALVGGGVVRSTDNGETWQQANAGFPSLQSGVGPIYDMDVQALAIADGKLFVGSLYGGVWQRPLSDLLLSVRPEATDLPEACRIEQNYPNPFNPTTTIRYALSARTRVILTVFNILGQAEATLVNGEQEAGYHEVRFDGSNLASGVYFYRIQAGTYIETKKLLLLR